MTLGETAGFAAATFAARLAALRAATSATMLDAGVDPRDVPDGGAPARLDIRRVTVLMRPAVQTGTSVRESAARQRQLSGTLAMRAGSGQADVANDDLGPGELRRRCPRARDSSAAVPDVVSFPVKVLSGYGLDKPIKDAEIGKCGQRPAVTSNFAGGRGARQAAVK